MAPLKIVCCNPSCDRVGTIINTIAGIESEEELDMMIEQWSEAHEDSDYCPNCGELGIPDED